MPAEDTFDADLGVSEKDLEDLDRQAERAQRRIQEAQARAAAPPRVPGPQSPWGALPVERGEFRRDMRARTPWDAVAHRRELAEAKREADANRKLRESDAKARSAFDKAARAREDKELRRIMGEYRRKMRPAHRKIEAIGARWETRAEQWKSRTFLQKVLGGGISSNPRVALSFFQNPLGFVQSLMATLPILGGILAAKDIVLFIVDELIKVDKLFKAFVDRAETRRNFLRDRFKDAQIANGMSQLIVTTSAGSVDPRDAYNTFEEYARDQAAVENRFAARNPVV